MDSAKQDELNQQLIYACEADEQDEVARLLKAGADVETQTIYDETPLHFAAGSGYESITKILLEHNASVLAKDDKMRTPLHGAASAGH